MLTMILFMASVVASAIISGVAFGFLLPAANRYSLRSKRQDAMGDEMFERLASQVAEDEKAIWEDHDRALTDYYYFYAPTNDHRWSE